VKIIRTVLCCRRQLCTVIHMHISAVLLTNCWFSFPLDLDLLLRFFFCSFVSVLFAFVVLV